MKERHKRGLLALAFVLPFSILLFIHLQEFGFGRKVDINALNWAPIELPETPTNPLEWFNIVDARYAFQDENVYFFVKWNGTLPIPINSQNATAPRYLVHRKAYVSWRLTTEGSNTTNRGELLVGTDHFVLFKMTEGYLDFRWNLDIEPFWNETTTAVAVRYQKGSIPADAITHMSISQASEYIGYHQYRNSLHSLSDIPETPVESIQIDGNRSDWENLGIMVTLMEGDRTTKPIDWTFPLFDHILTTRTTEGIYVVISLSNGDFTEFIRSQGKLSVEISWTTIIAITNGSYAADYALETALTYTETEQYVIQNVSITLAAGTDPITPSTVESWQLPDAYSGTHTCLEAFFPRSILSPLYGRAEKFRFYSHLIIDWKS